MFDLLYAITGFCVGFLVGMTGVGGGSLMTPVLILIFGVHPAAAVGTDLMYATLTKSGGTLFHGFSRTIDWRIVVRLATGSLPATVVTLFVLSHFDLDGVAARGLITAVLCLALFATAIMLIFRTTIVAVWRAHFPELPARHTARVTVVIGLAIGVLVSISSVGAGAVGVMALTILYPKLPIVRIVGSDIAHAVPLTLVAGLGHWMIGTVDWHMVGALLVGSLPGIFLGSYLAARVPERALRLVLAGTLLVVSGKLAVDQLDNKAATVDAAAKPVTRVLVR